MTPEEITKLAEEYAVEVTKDMAKTLDESSCLLNETKRATKEYITDFMQWLLRTHCIVSKEKVRAMMSELDNDIRTSDTLKFADTPTAQLQKGRMQGHSIGAKSALLNIFGSDTFDETDK